MKKIFYMTLAGLFLMTCKPEPKGELGEAFSKLEGMKGTWQIAKFSQRDENNPIKEVRDLSDFYVVEGEASTQITFSTSDMSYAVVPGSGKNYFGDGGTWHFDNPDYPTTLFLEGVTDTLELQMGSMPRSFDTEMEIELPRFCTDDAGVKTPTVTYIFTIQRVQ